MQNLFQSRRASTSVAPTHAALTQVQSALDNIILGKSSVIRLALCAMLARGHVLIDDVPGVGKSTLALGLARALGLRSARVQATNDLLPADVLGYSVWDAGRGAMQFRPGAVFNEVVLVDEINRAPSKTQSALLEAMEERQVTLEGETRALPSPFFVLATQNPHDQVGTSPLPESQLDRFLMRLSLGLPSPEAERELLLGGDRRALLTQLTPLSDAAMVEGWQKQCAMLTVKPPLVAYVQSLLAASRTDTSAHGLSPRAGLALIAAARAHALMSGRDFVVPDDVQAVFVAVAAHRLETGINSGESGLARANALLRATPIS